MKQKRKHLHAYAYTDNKNTDPRIRYRERQWSCIDGDRRTWSSTPPPRQESPEWRTRRDARNRDQAYNNTRPYEGTKKAQPKERTVEDLFSTLSLRTFNPDIIEVNVLMFEIASARAFLDIARAYVETRSALLSGWTPR